MNLDTEQMLINSRAHHALYWIDWRHAAPHRNTWKTCNSHEFLIYLWLYGLRDQIKAAKILAREQPSEWDSEDFKSIHISAVPPNGDDKQPQLKLSSDQHQHPNVCVMCDHSTCWCTALLSHQHSPDLQGDQARFSK